VLRSHAQGGLGEVFVAEDTELHREVALKEIQPHHADNPVSRARFLLEAEITGGLEHPGIVPVYGLGVYADGRPYYAMRFIRGDTLKEAIKRFHDAEKPDRDPGERSLALRHLLRRFIDVCNAVAYAHSRGVLHRDLKPANVMLGRYGETLVVDWGLAKPGVRPRSSVDLEQEKTMEPTLCPASGSDLFATQAGAIMGTAAYMSPEQASGRIEEMGPASDIYSLGTILYELLTGRKAFPGATRDEILTAVRGSRFPPPRQVKRDTPAALDAVCRKAMALLPADRYRNALDLAADVEHWLADEPVSAYREPWTVRLARWTRRHRTEVVGVLVLLVSAVVALSASTALIWREQQKTAAQQRLAEENYQRARNLSFDGIAVIEKVEGLLAADPALHATRKDLLTTASATFRQALEQQPGDPELQQRAAQVFRYTANVHRFDNEVEAAEPLYQEALRLQEGLAEQDAGKAVHRQKLAETLRDYGGLQGKVGRLREATDTLRRAVEVAEKARAEAGDSPGSRRALASALLDLSSIEYARGMFAESGKNAGRSADLFRGLAGLPRGSSPYDLLLLAAALDRGAVSEREQQRSNPSAHEKSVKLLNEMWTKGGAGANPDDVLHALARSLLEYSRTVALTPSTRATAEKNLGQAILAWKGLGERHPKIAMYREWQALAHQVRGQVRATMNQPAEARADFEASRQLLEELVKAASPGTAPPGDLGRTYLGLGRLAGNKGEAAVWFKKAADNLDQALKESPDNAQNQRSLKDVQAEQEK
jgi:serine/threonine-protein kinase